MFNLAQRQLRISLWGTELANRSTCKESKQEKQAPFGAMVTGVGSKLLGSCFCLMFLSERLPYFPVYSYVCTLHFFNTSVKQPNGIIPLAHTLWCLKLHGAVWQSNVQALASLTSISRLTRTMTTTKILISQLLS